MGAQKIRAQVFVAFVSAAALAAPAIAQTTTPIASGNATPVASGNTASLSRIRIGNFGKINDNYYRGAQPKGSDYTDLSALGVKTVIDLQENGPSKEAGYVKAAGMNFYRIGMNTGRAPTEAQIAQFFEIVNNPANQPVFVHCAGGRHRTGVMGAVYRFNHYGWNFDQVYAEMKKYDFYTRFGHGEMKKFVEDYAVHHKSAVVATTSDVKK